MRPTPIELSRGYCLLRFALLCLSLCQVAAYAQSKDIQQVTIESSWGGLVPDGSRPKNVELVIRWHGNAFEFAGAVVSAKTVNSLVATLREPVISKPDLRGLGIDQAWLNNNAASAADASMPKDYSGTPDLKERYNALFKDSSFMSEALARVMMGAMWTDDYPHVGISIVFSDGKRWDVLSYRQVPFMLPWRIKIGGKETVTYNARLSRLIVDLLPPDDVNRGRLNGFGLLDQLAPEVMRRVRSEWVELVEHGAEGPLAFLRNRYSIEEPAVYGTWGLDFGQRWEQGKPHEQNLHVRLRRTSFPPNFSDSAVFLFRDGQVDGSAGFLEQADRYENSALSIAWLRNYLSGHPDTEVALRLIHGVSFSKQALDNFAADMKALGKEGLATEIAAVQQDVALLIIGRYNDAYLLVLPDQRVIVRRHGHGGLFQWKAADLKGSICTVLATMATLCTGAVIAPDGNLIN
jgi:hypothetical protein